MKVISAIGALALTTTAATAGGFERSGVPVGFMFETGTYAELSFGLVKPSVSGAAGGGLAPSGSVAESYTQVGVAFKMDLNEQISLGLSIDPSFGADVTYPLPSPGPGPYPIRGTNAELNGETLAVIGRYKINENFSVHAGLRSVGIGGTVETFSNGNQFYGARFAADRDTGYLIGAAYERPDIALRVALTYQSETTHDLATTGFAVAPGPVIIPVNATTTVELPKSVTLDFQSGVAADTLVFGSIRWAEWTATVLNAPLYPANPLVSYDDDVLTYNLGVGRRFSDAFSGAISVGYEKSNGGVASNLSPTDGYWSVQVGGTYTRDNMKVTAGVRYVDIGSTDALESPPGSGIGNAQFSGNSAVALGLKVGFTF